MECYSPFPLVNRETQWDVLRTRVVSLLQPMFLATIFICTLVIMFFFSYRPKGGLTLNDSTNFQAFEKCSYWKSAPAPMQCARPCQLFHYFQFFAALPSGLPCTVQFFERSEAAIFRCVHWFNPSERKLLLVWAVSWEVSAKGKELSQCLVDWKK